MYPQATATPPFQDHSSAAQYPRPRDIVATKNSRIHCRVDRQFQFILHHREMIRLAEATALAVMSSFEARVVRPLMERNLEPSLWSHPAARMDPRLRARKDLRGIRVGILHSVRRSAAMSERQCRHCTRTTAQQTNDEYANCCCPSLFL